MFTIGRAAWCAGILGTLWLVGRPARAACKRELPALSEARAARFLIGDDLRMQSQLDVQRERLRRAAELVDHRQAFHLFGAAHGAYQRVFGIESCSTAGQRNGNLDRMRVAGSVGFTHEASGFHARVSFVQAQDLVAVPGLATEDDKTGVDATAGYRQSLVALRLGHERWFQSLFGAIGSESPYRTEGSGGMRIDPRLPTSPAPGYFFGATVPALRTSLVTLVQRGKTELISLSANELRIGALPFSVSLGPTYIREERQVVGTVRLRGFAHERVVGPHRDTMTYDQKKKSRYVVHGTSEDYSAMGPVIELSAEGRSPRLRQGRLRWQFVRGWRFASRAPRRSRTSFDFDVHAEGTLFRSRAFTQSQEILGHGPYGPLLGRRRGNAWGLGAGGSASLQLSWIAIAVDLSVATNRPELLSIIPSAAGRPELQAGGSLRLEY